jgi:hypothetical protein
MVKIPNVSDQVFEAVLFDIEAFPMSSMRSISARTGISYPTVTIAVRHMVSDGAVVRRRIGQSRGLGNTYANMVVPSKFRF